MLYSEFLSRLDKGDFTSAELEDLFYEFVEDEDDAFEHIEDIEEECRRWNHTVTRIYKIDGRYFALYGEIGNTEMQMDEFYEQPEEVEPFERVVIDYRSLTK